MQHLNYKARRATVAKLHNAGVGRNEIARKMGVSAKRIAIILQELGLEQKPEERVQESAPPLFAGVPQIPDDLANRMGDGCPPLTKEQRERADAAIALATAEFRKRQQANPQKFPSAEGSRPKLVIFGNRGTRVSI